MAKIIRGERVGKQGRLAVGCSAAVLDPTKQKVRLIRRADTFLSGKYHPGDRPTEGRIAIMPDDTEEAWHRRATERNWAILDVVDEIAEARAKSYPQVALAWLLAQPTVVAPIVGVRTPEQLEDDLGAIGWEFTDEELTRLNEISAIEEGYPYRMIRAYGAR